MSAPPAPTPPKKPLFVVTQARILHLLTVFIITPTAGLVTAYVAKILPIHFDSTQITAIFLTGAASGLAAALHFLHGWAWWEKNIAPYFDITTRLAKLQAEVDRLGAKASGAPEMSRRATRKTGDGS